MTARLTAIDAPSAAGRAGGLFLGFGNTFRKELTEWMHGPKVWVIGVLSIAIAAFTSVLTRIEQATTAPGELVGLSVDPTVNAILGWSGELVGLIAIIATMTIISVERDRGTLAWSLTNPVSPTSILAAKFAASMIVVSLVAVIVPMTVSVVVATVAYGGLPALGTIATFTVLFLTVPAFFLALTVALGAAMRSTAGIAAVALAVLFLPRMLGGMVPYVTELSPTSIGRWAQAIAMGDPAPLTVPISWLVSMAVIVVGAKIVFDRQEF
jgi:ABC-2 type transport system permease protein